MAFLTVVTSARLARPRAQAILRPLFVAPVAQPAAQPVAQQQASNATAGSSSPVDYSTSGAPTYRFIRPVRAEFF